MLAHVLGRTSRARTVHKVAIATTTELSDDVIESFCRANGWECFRGSMSDVLDRYYQAARKFEADVVVRITADCPLIDPGLIDEAVQVFFDRKMDFVANRLPPPFKRTYPIGLDVEVVSFIALERAWREAKEKFEREHVLPYLYEVEGRFKVLQLNYNKDLGGLRWTVDTPEDLELVRQIFSRFNGRENFTWLDVLELFHREPQLAEINNRINHKTYLDVDKRHQEAENDQGGEKS
jgi:spore coat polysaccharide biosynthesis protein SpsF